MIYEIYQGWSRTILFVCFCIFLLSLNQITSAKTRFAFVTSSLCLFTIFYNIPVWLEIVEVPTIFWYYFLVSLIVIMLTSRFFLRKNWIATATYTLFLLCFTKAYNTIFAYLYFLKHTSTDKYQLSDMSSFAFLLVLLALLTILFRKYPFSIPSTMDKWIFLMTMYCPVSFFVILHLTAPHLKLSSDAFATISSIILIGNIPIIYYFYGLLIKKYSEKNALDKSLSETQAELMHYRYNIILEEKIAEERHELKNRYFYIQTLLKQQKYEQLMTYVSDVLGNTFESTPNVTTGNTMVDSILNTKLIIANKFNVRTSLDIVVPEDVVFNETALCTILLNLLDNAIEASLSVETPEISITIKYVRNYLVCRVSNKVTSNILQINPKLRTTKEDSKKHGFGLPIIRQTLKHEDGLLDIVVKDQNFIATAMLPLQSTDIL